MQEGHTIMTFNDRTRNNGAKLIVKYFNASIDQHFYPIKITTTWKPYQMKLLAVEQWTLSRIAWINTGQKILQISELTGSNHRCRAQFKCAQTVVGQRFARNGPNDLSYYYYYYYYYTTTTTTTSYNMVALSHITWFVI